MPTDPTRSNRIGRDEDGQADKKSAKISTAPSGTVFHEGAQGEALTNIYSSMYHGDLS